MTDRANLYAILDTYLRGGLQAAAASELRGFLDRFRHTNDEGADAWSCGDGTLPAALLVNANNILVAGELMLKYVKDGRELWREDRRRGVLSGLGDDE